MTYNVEMVAESVTSVVTIAIRDVLTVIAAFGVMLNQSPRLTVFVLLLFPIIAVLIRVLGIAFRRYSSRIQDSVGEVTQVTDEMCAAIGSSRCSAATTTKRNRLVDVDDRNRKQNLKLIRVRSLGVAVTQVIFGFGVAGVIYMAGRESVDGNLSPGSSFRFSAR